MIDDTREQRLLEHTQNGCRDAFEQLIKPYTKALFSYILFRVKISPDANDIIQETMLSIWQSIGSYKSQSSFKTWAFSIARRRITDYYRKNSKHTSLPLTNYENVCATNDDFNAIIDRIYLNDALLHLNDAENELVYLIFQAQLSYSEISSVLGIPVGTVKSRMSSVKSKLKSLLGQEG